MKSPSGTNWLLDNVFVLSLTNFCVDNNIFEVSCLQKDYLQKVLTEDTPVNKYSKSDKKNKLIELTFAESVT